MRIAMIAISLTLASCAIYPTVPAHTSEELVDMGRTKPYTHIDVDNSRNMVRGLRMLLDQAATKRRRTDTVLREISFYGTLVLVGGTLEESIAARNIGAGSTGLASVFSDHYGIKVQRSAFTRAARQARCLEDAIRPIAPEIRSLFDSSFDGNEELANKYYAVPTVTIDAVNRIRGNLAAELDGVTLAAPSVAEVGKIFEGWLEAEKKAKAKAGKATVDTQDLLRVRAMLPPGAPGAEQACTPSAGNNTALADRLCEMHKLLGAPLWEQEDRKKTFIIATGTYAETAAACLVTKQ